MRLFHLLANLPSCKIPEEGIEQEIRGISCDSRTVHVGDLFVCLPGAEEDGHAYARAAYERGCRAFLGEYPPPGLPQDACIAYVPDSHRALAALAAAFYGFPEKEMTLIALTGTKGKTTTAWMIYHLLTRCGVACGYIGSGGVMYGNVFEKTVNTTPSALELRRIFADMRRAHVRTAVMEVSSQALSLGRVLGLSFPICLFTNLAPDHIGEGEHPDMAHYRSAKATLFSDYGCRVMVANADDESTPYMMAGASAERVLTVSCRRDDGTLFADRIRGIRTEEGFYTAFHLHAEDDRDIPLTLPLPGTCNVSNAMLALCGARAALAMGGEDRNFRTLAAYLSDVRVPGRFARVKTPLAGVDFIIDYAHNGYSLRAAITALRAYGPRRLVCLFGSVGGRTYSRRTELGEAACLADFCIVTTDNPGDEDPVHTMQEICRVLDAAGQEYVAIPDRREAIRYAVHHAREGDMVLLAGKGHEDYQLIGNRREPFCEREILLAAAADARVPI